MRDEPKAVSVFMACLLGAAGIVAALLLMIMIIVTTIGVVAIAESLVSGDGPHESIRGGVEDWTCVPLYPR